MNDCDCLEFGRRLFEKYPLTGPLVIILDQNWALKGLKMGNRGRVIEDIWHVPTKDNQCGQFS